MDDFMEKEKKWKDFTEWALGEYREELTPDWVDLWNKHHGDKMIIHPDDKISDTYPKMWEFYYVYNDTGDKNE